MKLVSWNVNGLAACKRKGFLKSISRLKADIVCCQEVRTNWCAPRQVDSEIIYILRMKILPAYHMVLGAMQPVDGHGLP